MPAIVPFSPNPAKIKARGLRARVLRGLRIDTGVSQDESWATAPHSILSRRASKLHPLANPLRSSSPCCSPMYKPRRKMLRMQRRASPEVRTPSDWIKAFEIAKQEAMGAPPAAWHSGFSGVQRLPSITTQSHKPSTKVMDKDLMRLFQDAKDAGCVVQVGPCSPPPPSFSPVYNALYWERASSASSRDSSSTSCTFDSASCTLSGTNSVGSWALSLSMFTKNLSVGWRRFKRSKVRQGMDFSQQPEALC